MSHLNVSQRVSITLREVVAAVWMYRTAVKVVHWDVKVITRACYLLCFSECAAASPQFGTVPPFSPTCFWFMSRCHCCCDMWRWVSDLQQFAPCVDQMAEVVEAFHCGPTYDTSITPVCCMLVRCLNTVLQWQRQASVQHDSMRPTITSSEVCVWCCCLSFPLIFPSVFLVLSYFFSIHRRWMTVKTLASLMQCLIKLTSITTSVRV